MDQEPCAPRKALLPPGAEELADSTRLADDPREEFKKLQSDWKAIGPGAATSRRRSGSAFRHGLRPVFFERYKNRDSIEAQVFVAEPRDPHLGGSGSLFPGGGRGAPRPPRRSWGVLRGLRLERWRRMRGPAGHDQAETLNGRFFSAFDAVLAAHPEAFRRDPALERLRRQYQEDAGSGDPGREALPGNRRVRTARSSRPAARLATMWARGPGQQHQWEAGWRRRRDPRRRGDEVRQRRRRRLGQRPRLRGPNRAAPRSFRPRFDRRPAAGIPRPSWSAGRRPLTISPPRPRRRTHIRRSAAPRPPSGTSRTGASDRRRPTRVLRLLKHLPGADQHPLAAAPPPALPRLPIRSRMLVGNLHPRHLVCGGTRRCGCWRAGKRPTRIGQAEPHGCPAGSGAGPPGRRPAGS